MWVGLLIFYVANVANEASVFLSSILPFIVLRVERLELSVECLELSQ